MERGVNLNGHLLKPTNMHVLERLLACPALTEQEPMG